MAERRLSEVMRIWFSGAHGVSWDAAIKQAEALEAENALLREQKDGAYRERDQLVAALSKVFPSHLMLHPADPEWEDDWRHIVCIQLPTGQATWHIHNSEVGMFSHLTVRPNDWDGHTTEEKYRRLAALKTTRLEAENARLRKVYEAAERVVDEDHDGSAERWYFTDYGFNGDFDFEMDNLAKAVREVRDA